jgi:serine phosphatase RsbU (regulator of sigma subunit)
VYRPAADPNLLGGDWYDALALPDGARALIVGDVAGHDERAAARMAQVRNMLRALAWDRGARPAGVLARLDATLEALGEPVLATACLARVEPDGGAWTLRWTSAGPAAWTPTPTLRWASSPAWSAPSTGAPCRPAPRW